MNFLSIQGLMGKLQAHEKRVNEIQDNVDVQDLFQKRMVLDILNEKEEDLKEEAKTTFIDQTTDQIKGTT